MTKGMSLSPKQMKVLTWWQNPEWEAIICDGAVRSGKTFAMGLSFFLWAERCFQGRQFGLCGKTIGSLRRNLLSELVPTAEKIGVIYTSSEDNSILQAQMAKEAIEAAGKTYVEVTVTNSNDVQQGMQELCGKCDAIYIPTDNVLASSMPIVYGTAVEAKKVIVTGESGMCMAGGTATLGIDYFKLGYQTGLMAAQILLEGKSPADIEIKTLTPAVAYNKDLCATLGIEVPAN